MSVSESEESRGTWLQSGSEVQLRVGVDASSAGERPLERFLTDWFTTRSAAGVKKSGRRVAEHKIPLPIRLTSDQLMDLADETELRALTLEWMTRSIRVGVQSLHTEEALLRITAELRQMAARLRSENWQESA